jgi:hydrogenase large subunit
MAKIIIDPVNRMEGHLGIEVETVPAESGGVRVDVSAYPAGGAKLHGNMYRGFEQILIGRDPRDAMVICQRI